MQDKTRAIVLAAGEGTRLRPQTLTRPKCLVEVEGISLLHRQIAVLRAEGIEEITLVVGYRADQLEATGLEIRMNKAFAETNMVWSLFCAEDRIKGDLIISYGDIVYSREGLRALIACTADVAVTVDLEWEAYWGQRNEDPLADAETLRLRPDGSISEIGQKPRSVDEIQGQYIGLIKVNSAGAELFRSFFEKAESDPTLFAKPVQKAFMTDLLQAIVLAGHQVQAVPIRGGWVEVDTASDLELDITRTRLAKIQASLPEERRTS